MSNKKKDKIFRDELYNNIIEIANRKQNTKEEIETVNIPASVINVQYEDRTVIQLETKEINVSRYPNLKK